MSTNSDPGGGHISFIALHRMVERKAAEDAAYRRGLERRGKPLLSHARALADEALLARLQDTGIGFDKNSYAEMAEHALSAEEVFRTTVTDEVRARFTERFHEDWVWLALTVLWERWFPQWPNFEQFDDQVQAGYALAETDPGGACEIWLPAWEAFLRMLDKGGFKSIKEFDGAFRGTQCVSNWVSDLEIALGSAGYTNPQWHERQIEFCEGFLRRFPDEDELTLQNMRRDLAEATFCLGDRVRGDALFEEWLKADRQWGWGWIGWADNYSLFAADSNTDLPRAEALLKQGLSVPGVCDREDILERLSEVCVMQGRHDEAKDFQAQSESIRAAGTRTRGRILSPQTEPNFGAQGIPAAQPHALAMPARHGFEASFASSPLKHVKVGRNDPCPCASGKKYKKCCLAKDEAAARQNRLNRETH